MTPLKRAVDIFGSIGLALILWPFLVLAAILILLLDGAPVFYVAERMKTPGKGFMLWKFRTMRPDDQNLGVSGGDKAHRITRTGRFLRKTRLDEVPQLWNIFKGDISFVGPRPPLRRYVEMFPDLYAKVLKSRPGVTGLATLVYHRTEERLLSETSTAEETESVYARRCVPRKARIDLIYSKNQSFLWDWRLMFATVFRRIRPVLRKRRTR